MFENKGFFTALRSRFERNRLGELLVQKGKLTPGQLHTALRVQKTNGGTLGDIIVNMNYASKADIRKGLAEQASYRFLTTCITVFIGFTAATGGGLKAKASPLNNRAEYTQTAMVQKVAYHPDKRLEAPKMAYPKLFGAQEVASKDISAFKKWTGILERMDRIAFRNNKTEEFRSLSDVDKIKAVDDYANQFRYIEDKNNFGQSDYWATPSEFFARGGDCEDFAIAKYAMLRELGIKESDMRLAIVQDKIKNIPHAILVVYTKEGAYILDNQVDGARKASDVTRYKPIYSINKNAWWRHIT